MAWAAVLSIPSQVQALSRSLNTMRLSPGGSLRFSNSRRRLEVVAGHGRALHPADLVEVGRVHRHDLGPVGSR